MANNPTKVLIVNTNDDPLQDRIDPSDGISLREAILLSQKEEEEKAGLSNNNWLIIFEKKLGRSEEQPNNLNMGYWTIELNRPLPPINHGNIKINHTATIPAANEKSLLTIPSKNITLIPAVSEGIKRILSKNRFSMLTIGALEPDGSDIEDPFTLEKAFLGPNKKPWPNVDINQFNFIKHKVKGGDGLLGGGGGLATGAGISVVHGDLTISNSIFQDLTVEGGAGGNIRNRAGNNFGFLNPDNYHTSSGGHRSGPYYPDYLNLSRNNSIANFENILEEERFKRSSQLTSTASPIEIQKQLKGLTGIHANKPNRFGEGGTAGSRGFEGFKSTYTCGDGRSRGDFFGPDSRRFSCLNVESDPFFRSLTDELNINLFHDGGESFYQYFRDFDFLGPLGSYQFAGDGGSGGNGGSGGFGAGGGVNGLGGPKAFPSNLNEDFQDLVPNEGAEGEFGRSGQKAESLEGRTTAQNSNLRRGADGTALGAGISVLNTNSTLTLRSVDFIGNQANSPRSIGGLNGYDSKESAPQNVKDIFVAGQLKYFDINSRKDSSESENGSAIDVKNIGSNIQAIQLDNQKERPDERSGPYLIGSSYVTNPLHADSQRGNSLFNRENYADINLIYVERPTSGKIDLDVDQRAIEVIHENIDDIWRDMYPDRTDEIEQQHQAEINSAWSDAIGLGMDGILTAHDAAADGAIKVPAKAQKNLTKFAHKYPSAIKGASKALKSFPTAGLIMSAVSIGLSVHEANENKKQALAENAANQQKLADIIGREKPKLEFGSLYLSSKRTKVDIQDFEIGEDILIVKGSGKNQNLKFQSIGPKTVEVALTTSTNKPSTIAEITLSEDSANKLRSINMSKGEYFSLLSTQEKLTGDLKIGTGEVKIIKQTISDPKSVYGPAGVRVEVDRRNNDDKKFIVNTLFGPDVVFGSDGDEQIKTDENNDIVIPGLGKDDIQGGNDFDIIDYTDIRQAIVVLPDKGKTSSIKLKADAEKLNSTIEGFERINAPGPSIIDIENFSSTSEDFSPIILSGAGSHLKGSNANDVFTISYFKEINFNQSFEDLKGIPSAVDGKKGNDSVTIDVLNNFSNVIKNLKFKHISNQFMGGEIQTIIFDESSSEPYLFARNIESIDITGGIDENGDIQNHNLSIGADKQEFDVISGAKFESEFGIKIPRSNDEFFPRQEFQTPNPSPSKPTPNDNNPNPSPSKPTPNDNDPNPSPSKPTPNDNNPNPSPSKPTPNDNNPNPSPSKPTPNDNNLNPSDGKSTPNNNNPNTPSSDDLKILSATPKVTRKINRLNALQGSTKRADQVIGTNKTDLLVTGPGRNQLTGKGNKDYFKLSIFDKLGKKHSDRIIDFTSSLSSKKHDFLLLNSTEFSSLTGSEELDFKLATSKRQLKSLGKSSTELIYFKNTRKQLGTLFVDLNGKQAGFGPSGGLLAVLEGNPDLTVADFLTIS